MSGKVYVSSISFIHTLSSVYYDLKLQNATFYQKLFKDFIILFTVSLVDFPFICSLYCYHQFIVPAKQVLLFRVTLIATTKITLFSCCSQLRPFTGVWSCVCQSWKERTTISASPTQLGLSILMPVTIKSRQVSTDGYWKFFLKKIMLLHLSHISV